jgi:two-component system, LytTR family, response regulator LytT
MNNILDAIIVEDEPLLAAMLKTMIHEVAPQCNIIGEFSSVEDTVNWLSKHPETCLIFMDIQLADGICFSIFDRVSVKNKGIVFTTAYDEYVMNAFEYNSLAYLLKPIRKEALEKVFEKIENIVGTFDSVHHQEYHRKIMELSSNFSKHQRFRQRLMITKIDGYIQVPVNDVALFFVDERVASVKTFSGQTHVIETSLEKLEEELNPDYFFRANRQYIINIDAIDRIENYFGGKLIIKPIALLPDRIIVSRKKASAFKQWVNR